MSATPIAVEEKARRLHRLLRLVWLAHGTLTVTMARRNTNWEESTLQRYVNELAEAGLITHSGKRNSGVKWQITDAGRAKLPELQRDLVAHRV